MSQIREFDAIEGDGRSRGYSLAELLIVLAIIGVTVAVAVPLVADSMRSAKVRGAADQLAMDMRAARMIAVSKRMTVPLTINADPANTYSYTDARGVARHVTLPTGVRITSASPSSVSFLPNGSLSSAATATLEVSLGSSSVERWTVTTNTMGVAKLDWVRQ